MGHTFNICYYCQIRNGAVTSSNYRFCKPDQWYHMKCRLAWLRKQAKAKAKAGGHITTDPYIPDDELDS